MVVARGGARRRRAERDGSVSWGGTAQWSATATHRWLLNSVLISNGFDSDFSLCYHSSACRAGTIRLCVRQGFSRENAPQAATVQGGRRRQQRRSRAAAGAKNERFV